MNQAPSVPVSPIRQIPGDNGAGGFRINLAEIAAAQQAPSIDARSFAMSEAAVGAAVGNAAQGLSEGGLRITQEIFASTNRRKVDEASSRLAAASQDIAREIKKHENDPSKWVEIFNTHAAKWEGTLLDDKTLSPAARDAISAQFSDWKIRGSSGTLRASFDQSVKMETEGLEGKRITAAAAGNWDEAEAVTREQEARGLIGADTAARQRVQTAAMREAKAKQAEAETYKAHEGNIIEMAKAGHLDLALKQIEAPGFMNGKADPADLESLRNKAQAAWRDRAAATSEDITNRIYDPKQPLTVAELNAIDSPFLTPAIRKAMKDRIGAFRADQVAAFKAEHGTENFVRTMRDARDVDFSKMAPDAAAQKFDAMIADVRATVDDDRAGEVTQLLHQKFGSKPENLTAPPEVRSVVTKNMALGYEVMAEKTKSALAAAEAALKKDGGDTPANRASRDAAKLADVRNQQAINKQLAAIERRMKPWYQANPNADETAALNEAAKLMPSEMRKSVLDAMDRAVPADRPPMLDAGDKTTAGAGDAVDLPGGPTRGPSSVLLPGSPPPEPDAPAAPAPGALWVDDGKNGSTEVTPMTEQDIQRWKDSGDSAAKVWDTEEHKFKSLKPSQLIPGRHAMPTSLFPPP